MSLQCTNPMTPKYKRQLLLKIFLTLSTQFNQHQNNFQNAYKELKSATMRNFPNVCITIFKQKIDKSQRNIVNSLSHEYQRWRESFSVTFENLSKKEKMIDQQDSKQCKFNIDQFLLDAFQDLQINFQEFVENKKTAQQKLEMLDKAYYKLFLKNGPKLSDIIRFPKIFVQRWHEKKLEFMNKPKQKKVEEEKNMIQNRVMYKKKIIEFIQQQKILFKSKQKRSAKQKSKIQNFKEQQSSQESQNSNKRQTRSVSAKKKKQLKQKIQKQQSLKPKKSKKISANLKSSSNHKSVKKNQLVSNKKVKQSSQSPQQISISQKKNSQKPSKRKEISLKKHSEKNIQNVNQKLSQKQKQLSLNYKYVSPVRNLRSRTKQQNQNNKKSPKIIKQYQISKNSSYKRGKGKPRKNKNSSSSSSLQSQQSIRQKNFQQNIKNEYKEMGLNSSYKRFKKRIKGVKNIKDKKRYSFNNCSDSQKEPHSISSQLQKQQLSNQNEQIQQDSNNNINTLIQSLQESNDKIIKKANTSNQNKNSSQYIDDSIDYSIPNDKKHNNFFTYNQTSKDYSKQRSKSKNSIEYAKMNQTFDNGSNNSSFTFNIKKNNKDKNKLKREQKSQIAQYDPSIYEKINSKKQQNKYSTILQQQSIQHRSSFLELQLNQDTNTRTLLSQSAANYNQNKGFKDFQKKQQFFDNSYDNINNSNFSKKDKSNSSINQSIFNQSKSKKSSKIQSNNNLNKSFNQKSISLIEQYQKEQILLQQKLLLIFKTLINLTNKVTSQTQKQEIQKCLIKFKDQQARFPYETLKTRRTFIAFLYLLNQYYLWKDSYPMYEQFSQKPGEFLQSKKEENSKATQFDLQTFLLSFQDNIKLDIQTFEEQIKQYGKIKTKSPQLTYNLEINKARKKYLWNIQFISAWRSKKIQIQGTPQRKFDYQKALKKFQFYQQLNFKSSLIDKSKESSKKSIQSKKQSQKDNQSSQKSIKSINSNKSSISNNKISKRDNNNKINTSLLRQISEQNEQNQAKSYKKAVYEKQNPNPKQYQQIFKIVEKGSKHNQATIKVPLKTQQQQKPNYQDFSQCVISNSNKSLSRRSKKDNSKNLLESEEDQSQSQFFANNIDKQFDQYDQQLDKQQDIKRKTKINQNSTEKLKCKTKARSKKSFQNLNNRQEHSDPITQKRIQRIIKYLKEKLVKNPFLLSSVSNVRKIAQKINEKFEEFMIDFLSRTIQYAKLDNPKNILLDAGNQFSYFSQYNKNIQFNRQIIFKPKLDNQSHYARQIYRLSFPNKLEYYSLMRAEQITKQFQLKQELLKLIDKSKQDKSKKRKKAGKSINDSQSISSNRSNKKKQKSSKASNLNNNNYFVKDVLSTQLKIPPVWKQVERYTAQRLIISNNHIRMALQDNEYLKDSIVMFSCMHL